MKHVLLHVQKNAPGEMTAHSPSDACQSSSFIFIPRAAQKPQLNTSLGN